MTDLKRRYLEGKSELCWGEGVKYLMDQVRSVLYFAL